MEVFLESIDGYACAFFRDRRGDAKWEFLQTRGAAYFELSSGTVSLCEELQEHCNRSLQYLKRHACLTHCLTDDQGAGPVAAHMEGFHRAIRVERLGVVPVSPQTVYADLSFGRLAVGTPLRGRLLWRVLRGWGLRPWLQGCPLHPGTEIETAAKQTLLSGRRSVSLTPDQLRLPQYLHALRELLPDPPIRVRLSGWLDTVLFREAAREALEHKSVETWEGQGIPPLSIWKHRCGEASERSRSNAGD